MTAPRRDYNVPPGFAPRLLPTEAAALYCGLGVSRFREVVEEWGVEPVQFGSRYKVWDVRDLDAAIDRMKGAAPTLQTFEV